LAKCAPALRARGAAAVASAHVRAICAALTQDKSARQLLSPARSPLFIKNNVIIEEEEDLFVEKPSYLCSCFKP